MKLIAGIDIKNGKCVHLTQGDINSSKAFSDQPIELCKLLEKTAIEKFHIVDIDGVFSGQTQIFDLLSDIRKEIKSPIQFGGGIRNMETAEKILSLGIDQIVLGTSAVKNQDLLIELLDKFGSRIIVAADVYKGNVYVDGWEENSSIELFDFLNTLELIHVETVMVTDISRDGTLSGADLDLIDNLIEKTNLNIIISGGINSDKEIKKLNEKAIDGVVVGTALYEGLITV